MIDMGGVLVLGYGNPGREDDGLGPAVAAAIEDLALPGVTVDADYQLNIEDAAGMQDYDAVLFVDASKTAPEPYELYRVQPSAEIAFTSHSVSPESVLAISEEHFGRAPNAWVLGVRGYTFDMAEGLSRQAQANLHGAVDAARAWIEDLPNQLALEKGEHGGPDAQDDHPDD